MEITEKTNLGLNDLDRVHVLLWSFHQGCFHVETLDQTIQSGLKAYAENRNFQDYIVLAVAADPRTLSQLKNKLIDQFGRPERTQTP